MDGGWAGSRGGRGSSMVPLAALLGGGAMATDRSVAFILAASLSPASSPGAVPASVRKYGVGATGRFRAPPPPPRGVSGASGRSAACPHGASERAPHDVDDFVHVLVGLAALCGRPDAALDVVLEDH